MKNESFRAIIGVVFVLLVAAGLAWSGSQGSVSGPGVPLFAFAVGLAFIIQWLAFIPAFILQTEKFYDLTGSITYLTVVISTVLLSGKPDARAWLLLALVVIWALRLGSFLFTRVMKSGRDARFDEIKPSFLRFLLTWTLQGLWVSFTLSAALAAITSSTKLPLDGFAIAGALIWALGFGIEVSADAQKNRFRANPQNKGEFIRSGLWAWSRHPNYFGEILLWAGAAVIALPVLRGWQWIGLISPVFVFVLITRVSGVPILEKRADDKWGGQADYQEYKAGTPVLFLRPPKKHAK